MTGTSVTSGGITLHVEEHGRADQPTVVLIHGFPDTSAVWDPVVRELEGSFHVVTYDVRGAGQSGAPAAVAGYRLEHLVADFEAVIAACAPQQLVHVVGHDWGSIQGWEIATTAHLQDRLASYTSISGPPLDHAGVFARRALREERRAGGKQLLASWYIGAMHLPGATKMPGLLDRFGSGLRDRWARELQRREHVAVDDRWPGPTFARDFAQGINLYRANVRERMMRPHDHRTAMPVQLVIATLDRFVTPGLLAGLEERAPNLERVEVEASHWVVRADAELIAKRVAAHVSRAEEPVAP